MKKLFLEDVLILSFGKATRFWVSRVPLKAALAAAWVFGLVSYACSKRRHIAYRNLRAAFASEMTRRQMKSIARRSVINMAMSAFELLRFPELTRDFLQRHYSIVGAEKFQSELSRGQGIIFLTGHFGNWELLSPAGSFLGFPIVVLARKQKHPRSDEFLNSLRSSQGGTVIRKGMPMREILRSLRKGKIVGIVSDQDAGKRGTFVRFFNRLSSSPNGVAAFALRTKSPIYPVFSFREGWENHRVEVEGPLVFPDASVPPEAAEREILQQFADLLEAKIRKSPAQWLWAHRRWKSTPDRFVVILSDGKAGHLNQSLAVLRALREERRERGFADEHLHSKVIQVRFKSPLRERLFKAVCLGLQGYIPFKSWFLEKILTRECYDEIFRSYADIVISAGHTLLGVNLLVKHENRARNILVMKPSIPARHFDAVITPSHDRMRSAPNVFTTERVLSWITEESRAEEADRLARELNLSANGRRVGLLVGGDTEKLKYSRPTFEDILKGLERFSREADAQLFAASSRRTPPWAEGLLRETFRDRTRHAFLNIANETNRPEVVAGILGLCDVIVVSGESMSMVSEAVSSGKPVVVYMPSEDAKLKSKYQSFLDRLEREKRIVTARPGAVFEAVREQASRLNGSRAGTPDPDRAVLREAVKRVL